MSSPTPSPLSPRAPEASAVPQHLGSARISSEELLRGAREIVIEHRGEEYRLLRTRNDRLILNK